MRTTPALIRLLLPLVFALAPAAPLDAQTSPQARAIQHLRAGQDALQSERFDEAEREFTLADRTGTRFGAGHLAR